MCEYFKIIQWEESNYILIRENIIQNLKDITFIENLLNILYKQARLKKLKNLNRKRLETLLIELEKIRLNLELNEME